MRTKNSANVHHTSLNSLMEQDRPEKPSRARQIAKAAIKAAAGVSGAALLGLTVNTLNGHPEQTARQEREALLKQPHPLYRGLVTLGHNAKLRSTPAHLDGTPENGLPNNVEGIVLDGKLTVNAPALVEGKDGNVYLMFTKPGEETSPNIDEQADKTVFADFTGLYEQGLTTPNDLNPNAAFQSATTQIEFTPTSIQILGEQDPANTTRPMTSFPIQDNSQ